MSPPVPGLLITTAMSASRTRSTAARHGTGGSTTTSQRACGSAARLSGSTAPTSTAVWRRELGPRQRAYQRHRGTVAVERAGVHERRARAGGAGRRTHLQQHWVEPVRQDLQPRGDLGVQLEHAVRAALGHGHDRAGAGERALLDPRQQRAAGVEVGVAGPEVAHLGHQRQGIARGGRREQRRRRRAGGPDDIRSNAFARPPHGAPPGHGPQCVRRERSGWSQAPVRRALAAPTAPMTFARPSASRTARASVLAALAVGFGRALTSSPPSRGAAARAADTASARSAAAVLERALGDEQQPPHHATSR